MQSTLRVLVVVFSLATAVSAYGQGTSWKSVKLKKTPQSYGALTGNESISVEGNFTDGNAVYDVVEEKDKFVKISDGSKSGWVFKISVEQVAGSNIPKQPGLGDRTDPLVGKRVVCIKEDARLELDGKEVAKVGECTVFTVTAVEKGWLWIEAGKGYIRRSDVVPFEDAIAHYTRKLEANKTAGNYWNRAQIWRLKGELDIALADINEAIRLNAQSSTWFNSRGLLHQAKQQYDKALADYSEAIRLDPDNGVAYLNRGTIWDRKKEYDKAIADYTKSLDLTKPDEKTTPLDDDETSGSDSAIKISARSLRLSNRASAKLDKGDYADAKSDAEEAIRLDPKYSTPYQHRGVAHRMLGDYEAAIKDLDEAIRLEPKDSNTYVNRGLAKQALKRFEEAKRDFDEAIRLDPKDYFAFERRGNLKDDLGDYAGALIDLNEAVRLEPTYSSAWSTRGSIHSHLLNFDDAMRDYDEAIRLDAKSEWNHFGRALLYLQTRRPAAPSAFQSVIDMSRWQGDRANYAAIFGCLSARLLGDESQAEKFLVSSEGKLKDEWPTPTISYLNGKLGEDAYLKLAVDTDKKTEAHCFIALNKIAARKSDQARTHLEWVRDHGTKTYVEYFIALSELRLLDTPPSPSTAISEPAKPKSLRCVLTEASGDNQITVDVLGFDGQTVKIRTADGQETSLPIEKISTADVQWLKKQFKP